MTKMQTVEELMFFSVQMFANTEFFKMEELPNRSPDIVVTALTLDDGEVAARRDFAQQ